MRRSTLAASLHSTRTVDFGTWVTRASSTGTPAPISASRTWSLSAGAVVISTTSSARRMAVALLHRPLDVFLGHVRLSGHLGRGLEAHVRFGIAAAVPGGDGDLAEDLREELAPLDVRLALLAFDL